MVDLRLGGIGEASVLHAPPFPADSASSSIIDRLFLGFFCFVLCIPFIYSGTIYLCIAQILLEFLLASC
jgi:predicted PilT family ATPase